jgi:hypothetical protein
MWKYLRCSYTFLKFYNPGYIFNYLLSLLLFYSFFYFSLISEWSGLIHSQLVTILLLLPVFNTWPTKLHLCCTRWCLKHKYIVEWLSLANSHTHFLITFVTRKLGIQFLWALCQNSVIFAVLGFELRAYSFSCSTSPFL